MERKSRLGMDCRQGWEQRVGSLRQIDRQMDGWMDEQTDILLDIGHL